MHRCSNFSALEKRYKEDRLRKQQQLPDVEATLSTLRLLQERSKNPDVAPLKVQYELCDTLYAKASIQKTENVFLWLGVRADFFSHSSINRSRFLTAPTPLYHRDLQADTFVEYSVDDAVGLLELQLKNANHLISELHLSMHNQRDTLVVLPSHQSISPTHTVIDYFKDQRNTTQVNIARIHNFGVDLRKRNAGNA